MNKTLNVTEINIRFFEGEPEWEALKTFPIKDDLENKAKQMMFILAEVYDTTKEELKDYFNENEVVLITNAFNGQLYLPELPAKAVLIGSVEDEIFYNSGDKRYDVDGDTLLDKLNKLTEFQALTVIMMAYESLKTKETNQNE
ncbi:MULTISPECIES: hypothetical protein [Parageobacillus]|uniref:hypothetical protein n=1 Tax=Parageobacillus TaxID=1906945 RepID=UPI000B563230|nr:hypothetical protein [Parageobacillus thermoglucosidasius]MBY6270211.1 hypothetical protein [Parageobacillus thermoglucosidasius]OUM91259.1 MAG: hypothetical protein BAA00_16285 [Parageobacillus thermoglucosidasius]